MTRDNMISTSTTSSQDTIVSLDPVSSNPPPPPIDFNIYATKKTVAEVLLNVSLLMANASQLRSIIIQGKNYQFYRFVTSMLVIAITLELITGVVLLLIGRDNFNDPYRQRRVDKLNNAATALVFSIVIVNVFIAAFGLEATLSL
ncbi:ninjurin-2-like isoform X2 [Amphiura filiformis]|uniref:ninjurin-2-like isoform X2 n=1 Tax=Amphiura filiformis TaxID=82378 RepID=UPI003B221B09